MNSYSEYSINFKSATKHDGNNWHGHATKSSLVIVRIAETPSSPRVVRGRSSEREVAHPQNPLPSDEATVIIISSPAVKAKQGVARNCQYLAL
jgi:hypothetical protein